MYNYTISKGGTFGVVVREYVSEDGIPCVVVRWGPLGCISPLVASDCHRLLSPYESEARKEAEVWLDGLLQK